VEKPIGFKEWSVVCEAMGSGRQSIILRKGGIHEGKGGFRFEHANFFLFPTAFHSQVERIKPGEFGALERPPDQEPDGVEIRHFARTEKTQPVRDWAVAEALDPFHVWSEETVRERFEYTGDSCLHLALVRVYRLQQVWSFPREKSHGGCRSWLALPEVPKGILEGLEPVVTNAVFATEKEKLLATLVV